MWLPTSAGNQRTHLRASSRSFGQRGMGRERFGLARLPHLTPAAPECLHFYEKPGGADIDEAEQRDEQPHTCAFKQACSQP